MRKRANFLHFWRVIWVHFEALTVTFQRHFSQFTQASEAARSQSVRTHAKKRLTFTLTFSSTEESNCFDASSFPLGSYACHCRRPPGHPPSIQQLDDFLSPCDRFALERLSAQLSDRSHFPVKRSTCRQRRGVRYFLFPYWSLLITSPLPGWAGAHAQSCLYAPGAADFSRLSVLWSACVGGPASTITSRNVPNRTETWVQSLLQRKHK